jgi:hypothetical protein
VLVAAKDIFDSQYFELNNVAKTVNSEDNLEGMVDDSSKEEEKFLKEKRKKVKFGKVAKVKGMDAVKSLYGLIKKLTSLTLEESNYTVNYGKIALYGA